jgi:glycine betaine catabolism A
MTTIERRSDPGILTAEELASVRRPYLGARLLPGRAYHDAAIYEWERRNIFAADWVIVGRANEAADPGTYFVTEIDGESIVVVRGRDGELRAFYNVCRHRGTAVVEEPCGKVIRFQCPYHAWIYDLDGKLVRAKHTDDLEEFCRDEYGLAPIRLEIWQGFVFLNLDPDATFLLDQLGDLVDHLARFDFGDLRPARTINYEVAANWKFIAENYSECYHCPGLHPQLNKLTPYDLGEEYETNGAWQGGWMEFSDGVETMALDGGRGSRRGRPAMAGMTAQDERRVDYCVVWPTAFLSIHPDYLLVHRLIPDGPARTKVLCELLFEPGTMARPDFDPSDAIAFWDLTNTQDWHVCELQQRGTRSRSWVAGRYSNQEDSVHAFDQMVADRYAVETFAGAQAVRAREGKVPRAERPGGPPDTTASNGHDRSAARTEARSKATARG